MTILGNLGRDTTLAYTQNGKAVCNLALAYTVGFGQNEKTQWVDCVLWGDRAVKLQPHLLKGTKLVVYANDLELETYQKNDGGQGSKLKCRVIDIEFAGGNQEGAQDKQAAPAPQQAALQGHQAGGLRQAGPAHQQQPAPQAGGLRQAGPAHQQAAPQTGGFDNFDDTPPF